MDRKFISLFAFFLFYLGQPADVCAAEGDFLFEGGTTGDSIVIADVKLEQFRKSEGNCLQIVDGGNKSTLSFSVSVPDGKTAQLSFSLLTDIDVEDDEVDLCNITFKAKVDDMPVKTMQGQDRIIHNSQSYLFLPGSTGFLSKTTILLPTVALLLETSPISTFTSTGSPPPNSRLNLCVVLKVPKGFLALSVRGTASSPLVLHSITTSSQPGMPRMAAASTMWAM